MTRAALRMADQRRSRIPDRCVKRGERTDGAVRAWAVEVARADVLWLVFGPLLRVASGAAGRRSERLVLPLSPPAWRSLRSGLRWAVVAAGLGLGSLALSVVEADAGLVALGGVLLAAAWAVRALLLWRRWVGLVLRPGGEEVALTRVSPEFGAAARGLFVGSVGPPRR